MGKYLQWYLSETVPFSQLDDRHSVGTSSNRVSEVHQPTSHRIVSILWGIGHFTHATLLLLSSVWQKVKARLISLTLACICSRYMKCSRRSRCAAQGATFCKHLDCHCQDVRRGLYPMLSWPAHLLKIVYRCNIMQPELLSSERNDCS